MNSKLFKSCRVCHFDKSIAEFHKDSGKKDGYRSLCKMCASIQETMYYENNREKVKERARLHRQNNPDKIKVLNRNSHLRIKYGINSIIYDEMLIKQNYKCDICKKSVEALQRVLYVDHDHKTGAVRSLLCARCNLIVGLFENIEFKTKIESYLLKHSIIRG